MKNITIKQWLMAGLLFILSGFVFSDDHLPLPNPAVVYAGIAVSNVNIHGEGTTAYVKPGQTIGVHAHYKWLWPRENESIVQIIVGLDGLGAQTSIANGIVLNDRYYDHHPLIFRGQTIDITEKDVDFTLVAPDAPGTYEVRFRYAQAYLPHEAVTHWWRVDHAPTEQATIGTIIVEPSP